jgi:hypothetical protein
MKHERQVGSATDRVSQCAHALGLFQDALGLGIAGIPAVWWLEQLGIQVLGVVSLLASVVILGIGIRRFVTIKAEIDRQPD